MTEIIELPRQLDDQGRHIYFTGGFCAANITEDEWRIEPVLIDQKACATGLFAKGQLEALTKQNQFRALAFHRFGWLNGEYFSSWTPILPGKSNHSESAAELWSNIARNIARPRTDVTTHPSCHGFRSLNPCVDGSD